MAVLADDDELDPADSYTRVREPGTESDDEPTEVTKLLKELHEERAQTRTSIINAGVRARHLSRRLRRSDSSQALRAAVSEPPPPPANE